MTDTSAIPSPPRPLTAAARRRSWAEMQVRIWVILASGLALVILYFTVTQIIAASDERNLITNGAHVEAKVLKLNADPNPGHAFRRNEKLDADLRFTLGDLPKVYKVKGPISIVPPDENGTVPVIRPGDTISLRIDPADPVSRWTDRLVPQNWLIELAVALMLLPVLFILLLIALLKRMQVLQIWQGGDAAQAMVVDSRHAAVAPRSRLVRMTLVDGDDRRVFGILVPNDGGMPQVNETVGVVMPRGNPKRAVLAKLYQ